MIGVSLNAALAEQLGWQHVKVAGHGLNRRLIGMPPDTYECKHAQFLPDWCGEWEQCGPLLARYGVAAIGKYGYNCVLSKPFASQSWDTYCAAQFGDMDTAVRCSIVIAVIRHLTGKPFDVTTIGLSSD